MVKNLDVPEITPHLNSQGLLTGRDLQILLNEHTTNTDKARYLLDALPRKERFFDKFLHCLYQTTRSTGHRDIAKALSLSYTERSSETTLPVASPVHTSSNKEVRATFYELYYRYVPGGQGSHGPLLLKTIDNK